MREQPPGRRDFLQRVGKFLAGLAMRPATRPWLDAGKGAAEMRFPVNLCHALFTRAERLGRSAADPSWGSALDLQKTTGIQVQPNRALETQLLLGTCSQLSLLAIDLLDDVFLTDRRLPFTDVDSYRRNKPLLRDVFGEFFGHRRIPADWPGMVYLQPFYISMKYSFRHRGPLVPTEHAFERSAARRRKLEMRCGLDSPGLHIPMGKFLLTTPPSWDPGMKFVRAFRRQGGIPLNEGVPLLPSWDENLGLAVPGTDYVRQYGHYPAYEPFLRKDLRTAKTYNEFRVLHLARFFPSVSRVEAWVHQAIFVLDPASARVVHVNTAERDFEAYVACYKHLGIETLLGEATGWSAGK